MFLVSLGHGLFRLGHGLFTLIYVYVYVCFILASKHVLNYCVQQFSLWQIMLGIGKAKRDKLKKDRTKKSKFLLTL